VAQARYEGVYARRKILWIKYYDAGGVARRESTQLPIGQEKQADAIRKQILVRVEAEKRAQSEEGGKGPITVDGRSKTWCDERAARAISSAGDDRVRFKLHVLPAVVGGVRLGSLPLDEVRPRHIRDLVRKLTGDANLAPRSIRNVYGMLHTFFHDAIVDELITSNPCVLKQGELPGKIDKDPSWRAKAVFSRNEVEQLISDERVPSDRRVVYGILFLAGLRCGEMAALTWLDYEQEADPLGKLLVNKSYSVRLERVKSVKTKVPREVPVHPTLARILAQWKLQGWQEMIGRQPQPDDLIVPARDWGQRALASEVRDYHAALEAEPELSRAELARRLGVSRAAVTRALQKTNRARNGSEHHHGMFRTPSNVYCRLRDDLERLGLRRRRVHDTRRTMITLALNDGARRDVLQGITHGFKGDIIDLYNTPLWELKCQELGKLKVAAKDPRSFTPQVLPLGSDVLTRSAGTRLGTRFGTTGSGGGFSAPTTGLEPVAR